MVKFHLRAKIHGLRVNLGPKVEFHYPTLVITNDSINIFEKIFNIRDKSKFLIVVTLEEKPLIKHLLIVYVEAVSDAQCILNVRCDSHKLDET